MADFFDYDSLTEKLYDFKHNHPETSIFSIGKSLENRYLYAIKLGRGPKRVFFSAAHHGMEWLTSMVVLEFASRLADKKYSQELLATSTLYIVPMVNPDGVEIATKKGIPWQANARGVDLNHNYDALWNLSKQSEAQNGVFGPGPTRFSGAFPESEPESRAIADFTRLNAFDLVLAFHSQGEVIYYDFCGFVPDKTYDYLTRFEENSPYKREAITGIASYAGYKDWFIKTFHRPGFTIEIGRGKNPLPIDDFSEVYKKTLPIMIEALK